MMTTRGYVAGPGTRLTGTLAAVAVLAGCAGLLGAATATAAPAAGSVAPAAPAAGADPLASLGLTHPDYNTGPEGRIPAEALGIEYEREPGPWDFLAPLAS